MGHVALPISDYVTDTRTVLDNSLRLLHALVDLAADAGWLATALAVMALVQSLMQARAAGVPSGPRAAARQSPLCGKTRPPRALPLLSQHPVRGVCGNAARVMICKMGAACRAAGAAAERAGARPRQACWWDASGLLTLPGATAAAVDALQAQGVRTLPELAAAAAASPQRAQQQLQAALGSAPLAHEALQARAATPGPAAPRACCLAAHELRRGAAAAWLDMGTLDVGRWLGGQNRAVRPRLASTLSAARVSCGRARDGGARGGRRAQVCRRLPCIDVSWRAARRAAPGAAAGAAGDASGEPGCELEVSLRARGRGGPRGRPPRAHAPRFPKARPRRSWRTAARHAVIL